MKYRMLETKIDDDGNITCTLAYKNPQGQGLVTKEMRATKLFKLLQKGEIELVNFKLNENGELEHIFGFLDSGRTANLDLSDQNYIIIPVFNSIILPTFELVNSQGKVVGTVNEHEISYILDKGISIKNFEPDLTENKSKRGRYEITRYDEKARAMSLAEKANIFNIICDPLEPRQFWNFVNSSCLKNGSYHIAVPYGKKLKYLLQASLWIHVDNAQFIGMLNNSIREFTDTIYKHDKITKGRREFFELIPTSDEKQFKGIVSNLMWLYGEEFCKKFIRNPRQTAYDYRVNIPALSEFIIYSAEE